MNGREETRRNSITSAGPAITPPHEASDFENVAIRRSTWSSTPNSSDAPAPRAPEHARARGPRRPSAGRRNGDSARRSRAAARRPPPSRTRRRRRPRSRRRRRRPSRASARACSIRLWRNARSLARERMQPSRIEAWSPESTTTVSPGREDRAERAEVRLVPGREHERGLGSEPVCELLLELEVQVGCPVQEARAGESRAVAVQGVKRALLDPLVSSQPQVVVGAEHDPALALHLDDRQGRALEHTEVRDEVELAGRAQLL